MPHPKVRALRAIAEHLTDHLPSGDIDSRWWVLHGVVSHLAEGAEALGNLHAIRNPVETDGAHIKRVAEAAVKFGKEAEAVLGRANKTVQDGYTDIEKRVRQKVRLAPDAYASEVRQAWRGMSEKEKVNALKELIDGNCGPELAAIIKAPSILTGMAEKHRQEYESAFIAKHAPEELRARESLAEAFDTVLVSARTASEVALAYADPAVLAEIAHAEAAAKTAAKTFDATVRSAA